MRLAGGPRPWPIRLFAGAFLLQAAASFLWEISNRAAVADSFLTRAGLALSDDGVIIAISARLSIALIPAALVWFFRSRFARWMVTVLAAGKLVSQIYELANGAALVPIFTLNTALALFAAAMLFMPGARDWFARRKVPDASVFK